MQEYTAYFDVDDTLIVDSYDHHECPKCLQIDGMWFHAHEGHIACMRQHKADGHQVVVWSQAGQAWAKYIVERLGIEELVDYCLSKPTKYYDDLVDPKDFMGQHVYLKRGDGDE